MIPEIWPVAWLVILLLVASATDLSRGMIYNWTTYPGIIGGVLLRTVAEGRLGFEDSLLGLLLCGSVMVLAFVLFDVGGGDVKLIAMMGACLGVHRGFESLLWTFVIGAAIAVAVLIWQTGAWHLLRRATRHLYLMLKTRSWVPLEPQERTPLRRPLWLAPAGLIAALIVTRDSWWP